MHTLTRQTPDWLAPAPGGAFSHVVSFDLCGLRVIETAGLMALARETP